MQPSMSEDFTTPMGDAARNMHELFVTFMDQGFTEGQALRLIALMFAETMRTGA